MRNVMRAYLVTLLILCVLLLWVTRDAYITPAAQNERQSQRDGQEADDVRGLWNDRFREKRPVEDAQPKGNYRRRERASSGAVATGNNSKVSRNTKGNVARPAPKAAPHVLYRRAPYTLRRLPAKDGSKPEGASTPSRPQDVVERVIGLTIWRLRPAVAGDDRTLLHEETGGSGAAFIPVRLEAETPLFEGERVRIGIESPSEGYLYVIDREQYANGSLGDPMLIFPTTRTRGGDNRVSAGRVIEIPAQTDDPPYLTVRPSRVRPDQTGELLTIIVTEHPLDLKIGRQPLRLAPEQVLDWEYQWQSPTTRIEQVGGAGQPWTQAEQEAGRSSSRQLVQDEPLPQTIYSVKTRRGNPLLVSISLTLSSSNTGK